MIRSRRRTNALILTVVFGLAALALALWGAQAALGGSRTVPQAPRYPQTPQGCLDALKAQYAPGYVQPEIPAWKAACAHVSVAERDRLAVQAAGGQ